MIPNASVFFLPLQWALWGEPHPNYLPHVYCPARSFHPEYISSWFHRWRQVIFETGLTIHRTDNAIFAWLLLLTRLSCLLYLSRLVLDFDLLVYAFGQFPLVVCTWLFMFLSVLVVPYPLFKLWTQSQSGSSGHHRLYSFLFGSMFLLYQALGLGFLPTYVVVVNSLPPASCFIVILEQVFFISWNIPNRI